MHHQPFPISRLRRVTSHRAALAVLVASTLVAAGCGGDDDSTPAADNTSAAATTPAPAELTAYCAKSLALEEAAAASGDPDADPVAVATALLAPATEAAAVAPAELHDAWAQRVQLLQQAIDDADSSGIYEAQAQPVHEFDVANCGWTRLDVTANEYHFTGVPDSLPAGTYDVELANDGSELHVMVVVERNAGVTESWDDLLNDPDGESKVTTVLASGVGPGESGYAVGTLEPGEYLVLCPIPQGTTGPTEGTGPPHFTLGMHQVLTVTA